jgi:hypothetical protein
MTKRMLLIGLQSLAEQYEMKWLYFIPSTLYGPDFDKEDSHFIFDLIKKIVNGKFYQEYIELWGDGKQSRELVYIDDAIEYQVDTFVNDKLLKDLLNKGEIGGSPEEIKRINQYIEPDPETGERKEYVEKLGFPQTLRAVEKTLQGEPPTNVEPKTITKKPESTTEKPAKKSEEPKAKKSEEPKAAKAEPKAKESEEDKATKRAKTGGSKLDKIANDQEALQKALKAAEKERLAIAEKRRNTEDVKEREKLLDDLKRVNKLEGELQKKLDQLGF